HGVVDLSGRGARRREDLAVRRHLADLVVRREEGVAVGQALAADGLAVGAELPVHLALAVALGDEVVVVLGHQDAAVGQRAGVDGARRPLEGPAHLAVGAALPDAALAPGAGAVELGDDVDAEHHLGATDAGRLDLVGAGLPPLLPGGAALLAPGLVPAAGGG